MKIKAKDFFDYYIIHPFSKNLSRGDKLVATVASVFFFSLSFGLLHLAAVLKNRKIKQQKPVKNFPRPGNSHFVNKPPQNRPISPVATIAQTPIDKAGTKLVCFYKTGPTEFLGNFAICSNGIRLNVINAQGVPETFHFICSEAAFQWKKYHLAGIQDPKMDNFFCADGEKAFKLNREFENAYRAQFAPGWRKGVRDNVMWEILQAKFNQNSDFRRLLDDTKGAYLLEHNEAKRDDYWSDNHDGSGKNMLGKMLMAIRDGRYKPPVDDNSDDLKVKAFAKYAQSSLKYRIF